MGEVRNSSDRSLSVALTERKRKFKSEERHGSQQKRIAVKVKLCHGNECDEGMHQRIYSKAVASFSSGSVESVLVVELSFSQFRVSPRGKRGPYCTEIVKKGLAAHVFCPL